MKRNDKKSEQLQRWIISEIMEIFALWTFLIFLKSVGYIDWHWAVVLGSFWWIALLWCAITALLVLIIYGLVKLKRWIRRRKVDRRVIRQAKAIGVWDKPQCLGGRALELAARKYFKIKRKPGETDKELRYRCLEAADNEYAVNIVKVFDNETKKTKTRRSKP